MSITNNSPYASAVGEAQLFVDVTPQDVGVVRFTFYNIGPEDCAICDVYFDDGALLALSQLIDADEGTGGLSTVDFSVGANPPDLPGGELLDPAFNVTAGFLADADPAVLANGVGPGEWLGVEYTLEPGMYYSDVIRYLGNGDLRIGVHVQGFVDPKDGSVSESFVHVPAPGAATLALAGIGMVGWLKRRYV